MLLLVFEVVLVPVTVILYNPGAIPGWPWLLAVLVLLALGLALAAGTLAISATNMFGDRWTYIQLNAWFWSMVALGVRARTLVEVELVEEEKVARLAKTRPRARRRPNPAAVTAV